ncbi:hypothetical protein LSH36_18g11055 [Paralvinella palmiformis]|uniref:Uncharacterized protein n=1 Tax=Paralvinella palmiformis TaxID=53620 RepID=A0AAD9KBZ8_9ANNE|nr:hypothetical protein LSH36_18g11055 [Paralvinella palmiformis]
MPHWLDTFYDKILIPMFGGTYDREKESSSSGKQEAVTMETFHRRLSIPAGGTGRLARGFDYAHWKPYGKRRHRYHPDEYVLRCKSLAPYVKVTAYSGYIGLEEKRWAGVGLEPSPLGTRQISSIPGSLRGSRDIMAKMGPGPETK